MGCLNCNNNKTSEIADGLYLCSECEDKEQFHLVQDIQTKEIYWKNINWAICDEVLI